MNQRIQRHPFTILLPALLIGCLGDRGVAPRLESAELTLGSLMASPAAVILSVDGTKQLSATGYSLTGEPITSLDSTVYQLDVATDTLYVRLDRDGKITALTPTVGRVNVNVFGYYNNVIKGDRILVQITETSISGLTLSIHPPAGDSTSLRAGAQRELVPVLTNPSTGESVSDPAMRYRVRPEDASTVAVYQPRLYAPATTDFLVQALGVPSLQERWIAAKNGGPSAWIYGEVDAYGTLLRDSVLFSFHNNNYVRLAASIQNAAAVVLFGGWRVNHRTLVVAPGATVELTAFVDARHVSFTFVGPSVPAAGNPPTVPGGAAGDVTSITTGQIARRRLMVPGLYTWTMTVLDGALPWKGQTATGKILVK